MADIKTIALPLPNMEYDSNNEALTRRSIEIAIEDLNAKVVTIQRMQSTTTSKASSRRATTGWSCGALNH